MSVSRPEKSKLESHLNRTGFMQVSQGFTHLVWAKCYFLSFILLILLLVGFWHQLENNGNCVKCCSTYHQLNVVQESRCQLDL